MTVEIRGQSGEVYAIRPTGERNTLRLDSLKDEHATSPSLPVVNSPDSEDAAATKEKVLALLRAQRLAATTGETFIEGDDFESGPPDQVDDMGKSLHAEQDRTL
jgi:hypothetical protein